MAWVKLDDGFPEHPKLVEAGHLAGWLHVVALCYCNRQLTDGKIPKGLVGRLSDVPEPALRAAELVQAGMWVDEGDSYRIHDYLEFQPSREKVLAERKAAAERQAASRARRASVTAKSQGESRRDKGVSHGPVTAPRPDPTPPSLRKGEGSSISESDVPVDFDTARAELRAVRERKAV